MKKNPAIPYILILVFGIVLVFILSFKGLGDMKEIAKDNKGAGGAKTEETASAKPEDIYKNAGCIGCHGDQYQGGMGPSLKGIGDKISKDEIKGFLTNGSPKGMPAGLVKPEQMDAMVEWVSKIK
ncbi:cytochrome c550 [Neobacillus vireti]|uniref:Cytochrome c550 n=1 Tax=Neobacillus vireti LMG 21834 TaxID=1131730 RepID=A0AB94IFR2_9BACI|nr:cytochrome c [Neobacillus vireti]ETI65950.1 cytochrome c550 [Neobacillus vireti LMG 21834]KLT16965.1 cytochrome C [Neobacillus vireti]